jgi:HD superfamily phosphohydrolase
LNKKKIINDPLYGFITIPNDLVYDIINHPYFQRLRRIKQLGLTDFVYPGALHTRFHHALGAMHLMQETLDNLRQKGVEITPEEYDAALLAILLHDVGHAPFSHALENVLMPGVMHEDISGVIIQSLNTEFNNALDLAIRIYEKQYPRKFLHQLVASQLDIDRLDYLNRDSFFSGVIEGRIGSDRIIKLLNVKNDEIVVEEKGIYSIENFLSTRRLMYWQIYLHKTVVGVESMLVQIMKRARHLQLADICQNQSLALFINQPPSLEHMLADRATMDAFCSLDDHDILAAIKIWRHHGDPVLSLLCAMLIERRLFKVVLSSTQPAAEWITMLQESIEKQLTLCAEEANYLLVHGIKSNAAYMGGGQKINVLTKSGQIVDIAIASDLPNIKAMRRIVKKYYVCWPKSIKL